VSGRVVRGGWLDWWWWIGGGVWWVECRGVEGVLRVGVVTCQADESCRTTPCTWEGGEGRGRGGERGRKGEGGRGERGGV
jgi:hypothetical protein